MKKLRNGKLTNRINKFIIFPKGEHEEFAKATVVLLTLGSVNV